MSINDIKSKKITKMNGNVNNCNAHSNTNNDRDASTNNEVCESRQMNSATDAVHTATIDNEVNNKSANSTSTVKATIADTTLAAPATINDDSDRENSENHQPSKCNGNITASTGSGNSDDEITIASIVPEQQTHGEHAKNERELQQIVATLENGDFSGVNGTVSDESEDVRKNEQNETEKDNSNNGTALDARTESKSCPTHPDHATQTTLVTSTNVNNVKHINRNIQSHVLENGHISSSSNTSENRNRESTSSDDSGTGSNENAIVDCASGENGDTGKETKTTGPTKSEPVSATIGGERTANADTEVISSSFGNDNDEMAFMNRMVSPFSERFQFYVPQDIVGRLIGKGGANVNEIKVKTNAIISVVDEPTTIVSKLCVIIGNREQIKVATQLIRNRFKRCTSTVLRFSRIDLYISHLPYDPNFSLSLSKSTINRLRIINVVNSSHFFFENPNHPMNASLEQLTEAMYNHYSFESLDLQQIIGGNVCVVFINGRWLRCMIVNMFSNGGVNVKLLDYGGYYIVPMNHLKQIHQNFLSLPFQAIEAVMHNIKPPFGLKSWNPETQKEHENLLRRNVELIYRGQAQINIATVDMYVPVGDLFKMFWNESLVSHHKADWVIRPPNH